MKSLVVVFTVAMMFGATMASAKSLPTVAAKVPADIKKEIVEQVKYPAFERNNLIEGEVWMKFTLSEDSKVELIELSSTNEGLGAYVENELEEFYVSNKSASIGETYYLKMKFDLINMQ